MTKKERSEHVDVCTAIPKWIWHVGIRPWQRMMHLTQGASVLKNKRKDAETSFAIFINTLWKKKSIQLKM